VSIPSPWRDPKAYDQIEIAGRLWPGLVRIDGAEQLFKWQVNDAKATSGATTAYQGKDIAKPKIVFVLWEGTDDQGGYVDYFAEWEKYQPFLEASLPPPGSKKDPIALKVAKNIIFEQARIGSISIGKIGGLTPDDNGGATVAVELLDFRPPKKAGGTPKASADNAPGAKPKSEVELAGEKEAQTTSDLLKQAQAPL
jgi:hypothetical protein